MKKSILILFASVCTLTLILFVIFNFVLYPKKYKNYVLAYSNEFKLETALVYAVIKTESNFDANAKSYAGAIGLMQIIPSTAKWIASEFDENYEEEKLYAPETNIKYGCFYLNYLKQKFSDIDAVICAYNAGETVVKSWLDENGKLNENKIKFEETKNYLKKVKKYYRVYLEDQICM